MKKLLLMTMLVAVASLFTACGNADAKLAQSLTGTWEGYNYIGQVTLEAEYQFFPCDEENTGYFVEVNHVSFIDLVDTVEFEMPYLAFIGGTYTVKDGNLLLSYDPETTEVRFEEEPVVDFITAYLTYDKEQGEGTWIDETPDSFTEYFIDLRTEDLGDLWSEIYKEYNENNDGAIGYGALKVDGDVMSYDASDLGTVKFNRNMEDWFEEYPF